jgi:hypothetical protein
MLGTVSLLFAIRNYRRQVNAQIFFGIAKRYHEILQSFPVHDWVTRLSPEENTTERLLRVCLYGSGPLFVANLFCFRRFSATWSPYSVVRL